MTEQREFYAASVDDAVSKAAGQLGVDPKDLTYRIVDHGNSGFLGIGARDARIEVEPLAEETPEDHSAPEPVEDEPVIVMDDAPAEEPSTEDSLSGFIDMAPEPREDSERVPQEVVDETEERVTALLDAMGFDARVDVYDAGGFVAADVAPDNTALFIGQKGETIDALQYLVNASINRTRTSRVRVVLDAEGYRQRRVEALQGMAHRTARKALREDRAIELPPMNPAERRVVHLFLRDNPRVTTESEGTGDSRRVRVLPA